MPPCLPPTPTGRAAQRRSHRQAGGGHGHKRASPISAQGSIAVLRGNLAPRWAITKQSATTLSLMTHTGRAVVFDSVEAMTLRRGAADLDVNADDVLVLRSAGPIGAPGMPEAGYLHRTPEAATGGPLALVRNGDSIRLNVAQCCIELLMDEAELALRRTARRAHQRRAGA